MNQKELTENSVASILNSDIAISEIIADFEDETVVDKESLSREDLVNEWTGKLIQYDWSGTQIQRIIPIEIHIKEDGELLSVSTVLEEQQKQTLALWQDQSLYLENLGFTLDKLYSSNPKKLTLDYTLLAASLSQQKINGVSYVTGSLDSYIEDWTEYGEPMSIVLHPKNAENLLTEEELLAISAQEAQFIKLYPVPFKEQLLIQYQLEEAASIQVEIVSFDNSIRLVLDSGFKQAGAQTVHTTPEVPAGRYIVRVTVNGKVYTRMIIKEN